MRDLKQMEKRRDELVGKPKSTEEIQEILLLGKLIALERAKEHQALTDELADIGIDIVTIWDLVNTKRKYPEAIPILIKHLQIDYSDRVKEGIVRALTVPEAKGQVVPFLAAEYLKLPNEKRDFKWAIGNAVNVTITGKEAHHIFPIVLNKENGPSREMFVAALGKVKTDVARDVLTQLLDDQDSLISDKAKRALKRIS